LYPGLSSLLQQLAADPSDELLASRIVALLQDIPDGEYKVDQLLAAAQLLLGVSPRLGLICAHAAFRSAPNRLESLAIAEEALAKLGRRAKVQVLRQERKKLEEALLPQPAMNATVSKFLAAEEQDFAAVGVSAAETAAEPTAEPTMLLTGNESRRDTNPAWWEQANASPEIKNDLDAWRGIVPAGQDPIALFKAAVEKADAIANLPDDELLAAVEKISDDILFARLAGLLAVDAVLFVKGSAGSHAGDVATNIMARLLAWHESDQSAIGNTVRNSVAVRLKLLPPSLQEGLARVLREQAKTGRPDPTFSTTTL